MYIYKSRKQLKKLKPNSGKLRKQHLLTRASALDIQNKTCYSKNYNQFNEDIKYNNNVEENKRKDNQ